MVHLPLCIKKKEKSFTYNSKHEDEFIESTPEKAKKKKKIDSPSVSPSVVVDLDPECCIPLSHPSHKKNKVSNTTQGTIYFCFGKNTIKICQYAHLEGNSKDLLKKEIDKHTNFRSLPKEGEVGNECHYKLCKQSCDEGVQVTGCEIYVCCGVSPTIPIFYFCSAECLWKCMTNLSKSSFTGEYTKTIKKIESKKKKGNSK